MTSYRTELTSGIFGNPNPTPAVYTGLRPDGMLSALPASGYYGIAWPAQSGSVIPQGISTGGWGLDPATTTTYDRGYPQQTFLGASIRNFSMNGGFGDSSSTLSVDLVADEYNTSDNTMQGLGDDVYHNGNGDRFVPPMAGSPVFFKFGSNFATVEEAYRYTFDSTYRMNTLQPVRIRPVGAWNKDNFTSLGANQFVNLQENTVYDFSQAATGPSRGSGHIVFGGILQSYIQNRGPGGNPIYSVQVTDPREILSNVNVVLNNYVGSTFQTKNFFNVYGFLEHNFTQNTSGVLQTFYGDYNLLTKFVDSNGDVYYAGGTTGDLSLPLDCWVGNGASSFGASQPSFPFTGTGMSRRGPQGIPYYRLIQGMYALMGIYGELPNEYKGYGGVINFRGYNYVVDFGGLPLLPPMYFVDFDQINLLDLALEICDVASRDLFVSLLPVINHPACSVIYNWNVANGADPTKLIAGIIRLDSIDRSSAPVYGAIKRYIDNLANIGILVENQDVGYELSNVVTDKFVVGAQEVDMYFFSANADKDTGRILGGQSHADASWQQWTLEKQVEQQIIPYYGTLGEKVVTIPKGWGAYQQVLLDTTGLNAKGVGNYYVATEMELRCASISYDCWKNFLRQYNDIYLESIEDGDSTEGAVLNQTPAFGNIPARPISQNYAVTVPRSVFQSYISSGNLFGSDNLPASPCNPPYGYPLYYKRMTKLGIPEGGLTKLQSRVTSMITAAAAVGGADAESYDDIKDSILDTLENIEYGELSAAERTFYDAIKTALESRPPKLQLLNSLSQGMHKISTLLPRLAKKGTENSLKVYEFLKKVADENLGKKFLIKIPSKVNMTYSDIVTSVNSSYTSGPFAFKPRPLPTSGNNLGYEFSDAFTSNFGAGQGNGNHAFSDFLSVDNPTNDYLGALRCNYSPITNKYEFNYTPTNLGGYFPFDLYANTLSWQQMNTLPPSLMPIGVIQGLIPQDTTNFIDPNGRLKAYVRFDNSQYLALGSLNGEDYSQQIITAAGMVPDLCEQLDNAGPDDLNISFSTADSSRRDSYPIPPKSCAFVTCTVDEEFYMTPLLATTNINVYGQVDPNPDKKISRPAKIFIPCSGWKPGSDRTSRDDLIDGTGCYIDSYRYTEYHYEPTSGVGPRINRLDYVSSNGIITRQADTRFVYALITLPNRVTATKDARYKDAINQGGNTKLIKHYLTMDVIKGLPEFNTPAFMSSAGGSLDPTIPINYSNEVASRAWLAAKKAKTSLRFGFPYQVDMSAPSPVSPDLVVLPLISNERCYGPWISSQVDPQSNAYVNVGGRLEFIKDENLAPWNYAGYALMNEAGVTQAQFANSLLLFSERGGFTFPGMPNRSLCQALEVGGPLVTNISVDVSEAGVRTTFKLDLYTANFGKLQKQKQDMISKISRERQRLRDERNALIRKGLGKSQSSINNIGAFNLFGNNGTLPFRGPNNLLVVSAQTYNWEGYSPTTENTQNIEYEIAATQTSQEELVDSMNMIGGDRGNLTLNDQSNRTGSASLADVYMPYSEQNSDLMPNFINTNPETRNQIYET